MKLLIIEDDLAASEALTRIISNHFIDIEIIGVSESVGKAIEIINSLHPDTVLMDIQLSDGNSFEILERIQHKNLNIIFITAYSEFAITAFKYAAIDYILKPYETQQLIDAIFKIKTQKIKSIYSPYQLLADNLKASQLNKKLAIPTSEGFTLLKISDIIRFQSDSNYTHIFSMRIKEIMSAKSLSFYNDTLENTCFERVHQSHLVNTEHISKYVHKDGGYLILSDGTTVPVSQRKKAQIITLIENMFNKKTD